MNILPKLIFLTFSQISFAFSSDDYLFLSMANAELPNPDLSMRVFGTNEYFLMRGALVNTESSEEADKDGKLVEDVESGREKRDEKEKIV